LARNCLQSAEKQGFQLEKAGKVMTVDHHDWELWERYFKALGFNFQSFVWKRYGCFLDQPNALCICMCKGYINDLLAIQEYLFVY
jgi:hypothetical protein